MSGMALIIRSQAQASERFTGGNGFLQLTYVNMHRTRHGSIMITSHTGRGRGGKLPVSRPDGDGPGPGPARALVPGYYGTRHSVPAGGVTQWGVIRIRCGFSMFLGS
eukprot:1675892-Rhodomonas_salina.2